MRRLAVRPASEVDDGSVARAVELVPGRVYVLSHWVELDGRVSWAPRDARGHLSPHNAYLLVEGDRRLLVDTGLAIGQPVIMAQLEELVSHDSSLDVFMTRAEFDTVGSLGAIRDRYSLRVHTGGVDNPFDAFHYADKLNSSSQSKSFRLTRVGKGATLVLAPDRVLDVGVQLLHCGCWPRTGCMTAPRRPSLRRTFSRMSRCPSPLPILEYGEDDSAALRGLEGHHRAKFCG